MNIADLEAALHLSVISPASILVYPASLRVQYPHADRPIEYPKPPPENSFLYIDLLSKLAASKHLNSEIKKVKYFVIRCFVIQ